MTLFQYQQRYTAARTKEERIAAHRFVIGAERTLMAILGQEFFLRAPGDEISAAEKTIDLSSQSVEMFLPSIDMYQ